MLGYKSALHLTCTDINLVFCSAITHTMGIYTNLNFAYQILKELS